MLKIDSHQHFWKFDPVRDSWINDEMKVIQQDFLPEDILPILTQNELDGCITVQSDQSEYENDFQLNNAAQNDFIKGIVGWVDFKSKDIEERLEYYSQFPKMKGFRHILQGESQRDFMLSPDFMKGIHLLRKYGFTYDILIFPDQLAFTKQFIAAFPDQPFVLNHIAKPNIKEGKIAEWEKEIRKIAQFPNLNCKISGMVTEAEWAYHKPENFKPYLDVVFDAFGTNRLMYGSDWPVCLLASSYESVYNLVKDYLSSFSAAEQEQVLGGNAIRFYNL
jgi:L-fuconolactonase